MSKEIKIRTDIKKMMDKLNAPDPSLSACHKSYENKLIALSDGYFTKESIIGQFGITDMIVLCVYFDLLKTSVDVAAKFANKVATEGFNPFDYR